MLLIFGSFLSFIFSCAVVLFSFVYSAAAAASSGFAQVKNDDPASKLFVASANISFTAFGLTTFSFSG